MSERFEVCAVSELSPGERTIFDADGVSVGVFNIDGEFFALRNVCPHQRAPLCEGELTGTVCSSRVGNYSWERDGEIIRCPWHGWEFDVTTGESVFNPHRWRARQYETAVEAPREGETTGEGPDPPVDTYPVEVEEETVVVYI